MFKKILNLKSSGRGGVFQRKYLLKEMKIQCRVCIRQVHPCMSSSAVMGEFNYLKLRFSLRPNLRSRIDSQRFFKAIKK